MPFRFLHGQLAEIFMGAIATVILAVTTSVQGIAHGQTISDNEQLRLFCIIGALGGAFLSISIFPTKEDQGIPTRRIAMKFFASGICGILFTPAVMQWQGWPVNCDSLLAVSGGIGLVSVSLLHAIIPIFNRAMIAKATSVLSPPPTDQKPPQ